MNRKAILKSTVIYLLITLAVVAMASAYIWLQMNGASIWSDYYAKELTRTINSAQQNETITFDVQKAVEVAGKNNIPISEFSSIFSFDNPNNEVCVKLSRGIKTCYKYFNDVDIIYKDLKQTMTGNVIIFEITKPLKESQNENNSTA